MIKLNEDETIEDFLTWSFGPNYDKMNEIERTNQLKAIHGDKIVIPENTGIYHILKEIIEIWRKENVQSPANPANDSTVPASD